MNTTAATNFLQAQADYCASRVREADDLHTVLKYSILADIYFTLAGTIQVLMTGVDPALGIGEALDGHDKKIEELSK